MTRSIPPSLAPVLEHLELERPKLVSVAEIATIAEQFGILTPGKIVAHRLAERGWLLPTEVRGVWEFAPADQAGPISGGDGMLTLLAIVAGGASRQGWHLAPPCGCWTSQIVLQTSMKWPFLSVLTYQQRFREPTASCDIRRG